jgi:FtsP/CotA-like multicopper oxidase with cupredoxin domain
MSRQPETWETGLEDTVTAYPGEVTRPKAQFKTPGRFVWHCHIVSHEDNGMMRPFRIGPEQPGRPSHPQSGEHNGGGNAVLLG